MVASGMADVGYQYVSIDGCWQNAASNAQHNDDPLRVAAPRDAQGNILPNRYFPDMRALADYIHSKGLKAGIYTSPGPLDCAGFTGSYQHEAQDARQFRPVGLRPAQVRLVLLWPDCRPRQEPRGPAKAYKLMGQLLKQQHRDIVYNLCQYGMGQRLGVGSRGRRPELAHGGRPGL